MFLKNLAVSIPQLQAWDGWLIPNSNKVNDEPSTDKDTTRSNSINHQLSPLIRTQCNLSK